jgi:alpha-L-rhamnosidase
MIGMTAKWIQAAGKIADGSSPLFRREFEIEQDIKSATLMICGLGYFEAWINGRRVGDHVLDPAQSDYEERCFYITHDVTRHVETGANAIGVMLGDGFYNQKQIPAAYGWQGEEGSYGEKCLYVFLKIVDHYGDTHFVESDGQWKTSQGPVIRSNVYGGEEYDARLEKHGWRDAGYDDTRWADAKFCSGPSGILVPQEIPPMRKIEEVSPVLVESKGPGSYIVDLAQNLSGWIRIRLNASSGHTIKITYAECLDENGDIDTGSTGVFATTLEQIDKYTAAGSGVEEWEPRFTYHGFRYALIENWPGEMRKGDVVGVVVHTDLRTAGSFSSSDLRLNKLHQMALWTLRSNIHSVPEDCPAREKCGWLGDANMVAEYSMWNYDAESFWRKFLDDIETTRKIHGGYPCNIAPGKRTAGLASYDWAAAFVMIPWYLYVFTGKTDVLERHWDGMEVVVKHYKARSEKWILHGGYGDWYDPGGESCCSNTEPSITTTFWFYRCATVISKIASLLNRGANSEKYLLWSENVKNAAISKYFDNEHGTFGSQTADAMALHFKLVSRDDRSKVFASLVRDIEERGTHLNTGIMGTRCLFEVLSEYGRTDLAYAIMQQDTYPGFGDQIRKGATTLWECWEGLHHPAAQSGGPRSLNHPMMGGFDNWFYNTLAGIKPCEDMPGFRRIFMAPKPIAGLEEVKAWHYTPSGKVSSEWSIREGEFNWTVVVPDGSSAYATMPFSGEVKYIEAGRHVLQDTMVPAKSGSTKEGTRGQVPNNK